MTINKLQGQSLETESAFSHGQLFVLYRDLATLSGPKCLSITTKLLGHFDIKNEHEVFIRNVVFLCLLFFPHIK